MTHVHTERGGNRVRDHVTVAQRREVDEPRATEVLIGNVRADANRQPRLADTAGAGERDEAVVDDHLRDRGEVAHSPDERCQRLRQIARQWGRRRLQVESGIVSEDRRFERAQLGRGLDADIVGQALAVRIERSQRLDLPTGSVEGEHAQGRQSFAEWVRHGELGELTHHFGVPSGVEQSGEPALDGGKAQRFEPGAFRRDKGQVTDVDEDISPPEGEGGIPIPSVGELLELTGVELVSVHVDDVAAARRAYGALPQHLAELGHVLLQRLVRGHGRAAVPHIVDEPIDGHDATRVDKQSSEHRPLAQTAEGDGFAVAHDLQRAEDRVLHHRLPPRAYEFYRLTTIVLPRSATVR